MKKIIFIISIFFLCSLNVLADRETVEFKRCVDGDTFRIILNKEEVAVRMIAIDTPESVKTNNPVEYYGKEASEYTCNTLTNAKKIELEYDSNSSKYDKYDRLIAWVYVDNKLLQELLVEKGYAKVAYLYGDYKYVDILKEKQEIASSKEIGVWNEEAKEKYDEENNIEEEDTDTSNSEDDTSIENIEIIIASGIILLSIILSKIFGRKK